jgi:hypothetical protein
MEFDRLGSKSSENTVHVTKIVLVLPENGSEAHKSTLREQRSCILDIKDTKTLEKEHKNLGSEPFPVYSGRRL